MNPQRADLSAVNDDDALLDRLAERREAATGTDPAAALLVDLTSVLDQIPDPGERPVTSQLPRKRRRHARAIALPAAVVVLLATAGTAAAAAGAGPDSPLHAIHTLIFGADQPAPADQVRTLLRQASHDLDLAARSPNPARDPHLTTATKELAAVPPLIAKVTDPVLATSLRANMTALQGRADLLRQQDGQVGANSGTTNPPATAGGGDQPGTTNPGGTPSQPGTPHASDTNQPSGANQPSGTNQPSGANQPGGTANAS